jgi:catechol 2,3-dioxygenase-like lactoylglutathione lyase family enzyme
MIRGLHHATFLTSDLSRARQFYETTLGLRPDSERPEMTFDGVWYDLCPGQQLHLMRLPDPEAGLQRPAHGGRDRHVAFAVDALDALAKRLALAQVTYTLSQSGRRALFCRDPDGNALEFIEMP